MGRPSHEYFPEFRLVETGEDPWLRLSDMSIPLVQAELICKKRFDQCSYATGRKIEFRLVQAASGKAVRFSRPPHAWRLAWSRA